MVKTKITETIERYDKDGKLIEKSIREETTEDNTVFVSTYGEKIDGKSLVDEILKELRRREKSTGKVVV